MSAYVIALLCALSSLQAGVRARDARAIEAAKNTNVQRINPLLPNKAFGVWLRDLAGTHRDIRWEVNDCGEQTGNPQLDKERDFPMCAEAQVTLERKRKLSVSLGVGTFKTGVKSGPASFYSAVIEEANGAITSVKNLSQLAAAIKTAK